MSKAVYYFLHIPKTAGTIRSWFQARPDFRVCPDILWSELLRRDRATLSEFNLFVGHFYTALPSYLNRELVSFTFLRHPVSRSISHYLHIIREQGHYLHERRTALVLSRRSWMILSACRCSSISKPCALSMECDPVAVQRSLPDAERGRFPPAQIESSLDGYTSAVNLPLAMEFLDRCKFVGVTERMEDSMARLDRFLAQITRASPPLLNVASNKSDMNPLPSKERKRLLQLLADDMVLYEMRRQSATQNPIRPITRNSRFQARNVRSNFGR